MSDFGFHKFVIEMRDQILTALVTVNENVQHLRQELADMAGTVQQEIDNMRDQVAHVTGVVDSTKTLLQSVANMLVAAADDPDEINAIATNLRAKSDELAAAVASFPGQTPPTPTP